MVLYRNRFNIGPTSEGPIGVLSFDFSYDRDDVGFVQLVQLKKNINNFKFDEHNGFSGNNSNVRSVAKFTFK